MKKIKWIAGPCAAETERQLWETAKALKAFPEPILFRCGVWKARSHPSDFEGWGEAALPVLQRIQQELGMEVCAEVASPWHVEQLMRHDIRTAWVGARTTVNPFVVQELAEAARGTDLRVMVKNPVAPDLKLWEGAFERFAAAGLKEMAAIYRGFTTSLPTPYRNHPMWTEYIRWKSLHPEIPLYCDPSHIAGDCSLVREVAQKALLLDCDGLMVEVHVRPQQARSDARQQLSPQALMDMYGALQFPEEGGEEDVLAECRAVIDALDGDLLAILAKRMETVRQIARHKQAVHLPLLQVDRWQKVMEQALRQAVSLQLRKSFVEELMQLIHAASIEEQEKVLVELSPKKD